MSTDAKSTKGKKRKPSAAKRKAIMVAAMAEFHESGFGGTSMDKIAERAGVSKRTVYNHFESKENLFRSVLEDAGNQGEGESPVPCGDCPCARTHLEAFIRFRLALCESDEHVATMKTVLAELIRNPDLPDSIVGVLSSKIGRAQDWMQSLSDGCPNIHIPNSETAAIQLISLIQGFFLWPRILLHQDAPNDKYRDAAVRELVEVMMARYGVDPDQSESLNSSD